MARLKPLDLAQVQTDSVRRRRHTLSIDHLAAMPNPAGPLTDFYRSLPKIGACLRLREAAELVAQTALANRPIIWLVDRALMDAGLSSQLVYLIQRGLVHALVMNGEAAVRDYELAFHGCTAEDLGEGLADGRLGLGRETGEGINAIINEGVRRGFGVGECLGRGVLDRQPRHFTSSILATAAARLTATTIHFTLGADGFHRYPGADGALLGKGSLKDAHMLGAYLATLPPESLIVATHADPSLGHVFINALGLGRNLNDAMPWPNVLLLGDREDALPTLPGSRKTCRLNGPLELMIPLLLGALFSLVE